MAKKKAQSEPEQILSMKEAAALCGMEYHALHRRIKAGKGPKYSRGEGGKSPYLFRKSDVESWLKAA